MKPNKNDPSASNNRPANPGAHARRGRPSSAGPAPQRTLRDYLLMIRERWILGLAAALLLVGLLLFFQLRQPRLYQAEASLLFESSNLKVVDIQEVVDTTLHEASSDTRLNTHIGQIQSAAFATFVAATFTEEEVEDIGRPYRLPGEDPPPPAAIIGSGIEASINRGTFILTIAARHRDRETAALIANRYANMYIEYNRDRTESGNVLAVRFLREQADELLQKVEESEQALHDYRRRHNLVSLEENQNTILRRLDSISASVVEARVARLDLDSRLEHVQRYLDEGGNLMEIDYIADYGSLARLYDELDQRIAARSVLNERYLEMHPQMIQNNSEIESLREQIDDNIRLAVTELKSRHERALSHEQKLQEALAEAEEKSLELEEVAVRYRVLDRQAAADRESYARIMDRLSETEIASQLEEINIRMVDTAATPHAPVVPNLQKVIIQSAFLGLFAFFGLPLGLGLLDNKLKGAREAESLLSLPLLGEIPRIKELKKKDRPNMIADGAEHSACEAFRGIFSQMQVQRPPDFPHTILITSTVPGEGKSFVTNNLAATFALHGRRTLLVDCDFRRPSLHIFYERKNDRGIIRWMENKNATQNPVREDEALGILPVAANLRLLRVGGESRTPTSIFNHPDFRSLLAQAGSDYDVVLIDTPPVGVFPDSLLLAPLADEILYICQFNRVNKAHLQKFVEKIQLADVEVGGLILNGIPTGRTSLYYSYYGYGQVNNDDYKAYYAKKR